MAEILSLSKARKAKARVDKDATAEANRQKFGRTKAEREKVAAEKALADKSIDAHKRDQTSERAVLMTSFFDFSARRIDGTEQPMSDFAGKVILPVNTASKCGFTRQYDGLEKLWQDYKDRGLVVLGFPCNQFGEQEPGSAAEIAAFCATSFSVSFPLFDKVEVNGKHAHPIWAYLKAEAPGFPWFRDIGWNFTKFLVDRNGKVTGRYTSSIEPEALAPQIEKLL